MPVITREVILAANAINENLLSGSAFEFVREPSLITWGVTCSAAGLFVTIQSGADIVAEEFTPVVAARFPVIPDEFYFSDFAAPGDRLVVRARNSTAGGLVARVVCQVTATR